MAINKQQIRQSYPLPSYNYKVRIGAETYGFSQVSGLSFKYDTITYRHGLSMVEGADYLIGILEPINLTLQRGIVPKGSILLEWISNVHNFFSLKEDITIDLCDEKGEPLVSWRIQNAIPVSYEVNNLEASSNEVALETLSMMANNMHITYHATDQSGGTRGVGFNF